MTGGVVVILGRIGANFAAGMTGGEAFAYDPHAKLVDVVNPDSVLTGGFADEAAEARCRTLVERHARETGSALATKLIDNWDVERGRFVHVVPKEIAAREGIVLKGVA